MVTSGSGKREGRKHS